MGPRERCEAPMRREVSGLIQNEGNPLTSQALSLVGTRGVEFTHCGASKQRFSYAPLMRLGSAGASPSPGSPDKTLLETLRHFLAVEEAQATRFGAQPRRAIKGNLPTVQFPAGLLALLDRVGDGGARCIGRQ